MDDYVGSEENDIKDKGGKGGHWGAKTFIDEADV